MSQRESSASKGEVPINVRAVMSGVGWTGAGQVGTQVAWFGSLIVLGVLLPPRLFGIVAAGVVMVNMATLLMGSGTKGSIVVGEELTRKQVRGALRFNVVSGTALCLGLALLAGPIVAAFAHGGDPWVVRVLGLGLLLNASSLVPRGILQKRMQFKRQAAAQTAAALIGGVGAIVAGFAGAGVWALVLRILLNNACWSAFTWVAAWPFLPTEEGRAGDQGALRRLQRHGARFFLILAAADFLAISVDNLIVGGFTNSTQLGLYSLAFTLAFAPLTQFSWQLGSVLFSVAAATETTEALARRTIRALRMITLVLLPLVTPVVLLAPVVLSGILGHRWHGIVTPFQLLLGAGVLYAMTNVIGEAFSGSGNIAPRSLIEAVWAVATAGVMVALVRVDGIRGAALTHLALSVPLLAAYALLAGRRLGAGFGPIWAAIRDVVRSVAVQALTSLALLAMLRYAGVAYGIAATAAAATGAAAAVALLVVSKSKPLREGKAILMAGLRGGAAGV
jgi:O-antigen/teichoic acid export membrane protein